MNITCYHYDDLQYSYIYDTLGRYYITKKRPYEAIAYFTWAFNQFRAEHQTVEANEALQFLLELTSELLDPWQLLKISQKEVIPSSILAHVHFRLGMNEEARKLYLELIHTLYLSEPTDHLRLAEYLTRLGEIYKIRSIFLMALDRLRTVLPEQHPLILEVINLFNSNNALEDDVPFFEISIVYQQGHAIRKVVVERSDTINDIKALLQRQFGLVDNMLTLQIENGRVLDDDSATVGGCSLHKEARLLLSIDPEPKPRRIFVQSGISVIEVADVHWWQSIYDIKRFLHNHTKLPPPEQQRLFEAGRELSNHVFCGKLKYPTTRLLLALRECEAKVESENLLNFSVHLPLPANSPQRKRPVQDSKHDTHLSNVNQDIFEADRDFIRFENIARDTTVEDLQAAISEASGIPIQFQRLTLETTELSQSTATLASYGIHHSSMLELQVINVPRQVTFVVQDGHEKDRLKINFDETISGLTKHVAKKIRASPETVALEVFGGKLFPDHHSILKVFHMNQHIEDSWEVDLSVSIHKRVSPIYYYGVARVTTCEDTKSIQIHLNSQFISFDELQALISNQTGIQISDQRLYADGKLLCSGQKLESFSFKKLLILPKQPVDFTIKINVPGHSLLRLRLRSATTVQDVKRMIKCLRGVSIRKQRLFLGRTELTDCNEIIQTRGSGRRVDVVSSDEKVTFVRYKKRWILSEINPWENVAKIKAKLQSKLSISLEQYLVLHDGVVLRLDVHPYKFTSDKSELHLVRSRTHLDYIYVREHDANAIAVCEWSPTITIDDIRQAIARLHTLPIVQSYCTSNELKPNSTVYLVRLISLRVIDPEKKSIMDLSIESQKTILELKQQLHILEASVQRELLYQNDYLSNDEIVGKYHNATILIQSISRPTLDDDPFDPLYIQREQYYLEMTEDCLEPDSSDDDAVRQWALRFKALKEFKRQAKYGDKNE